MKPLSVRKVFLRKKHCGFIFRTLASSKQKHLAYFIFRYIVYMCHMSEHTEIQLPIMFCTLDIYISTTELNT